MATPRNTFFSSDQTQRSVWVVVEPRDFVTGARVTAPLRVRLKDRTNEPILARSGVYCFTDLNLPAAQYTVQVEPLIREGNQYLDTETTFTLAVIPIAAQPLKRNPVTVDLMPSPTYPFDGLATLARGQLLKTSDSLPVKDAKIFLILDTVDVGLRGQTDKRGEFVLFFPKVTPTDDPTAGLKDFKFRLRFEIPNQAPFLTADETVKEGTTKSMQEIKFPGI